MKLGVIVDGISRDLEHALNVMDGYGIRQAELQYVWDKEVGDHDAGELARIGTLLRDHGMSVPCLSRHILAGLTAASRPGDPLHQFHMEALKRVIEAAHVLDAALVRIMTPKKEAILWGENGAEQWNAARGAWESSLELVAPAVELARSEGATLVTETGNGIMVNSAWTGRKLIDDLDALPTLRILWDPANCCWCHETAWPDGYDRLRGGYLGHIHIKDVKADTPRATLANRPMCEGQLADQFAPMADALRADGYEGAVSYESVYRPDGGTFEDGFHGSIRRFQDLFGPGHA